ncbi:hypothetical protein T265_12089 [Opisthorchis viverrini]|uniref:Uncharacterized protein n=1 Tax=Opisthorchis viverrini TaxID=6198 RepID=A0A074ZUQ9_OPIVI|nr:hypothetical protein T265_12089 [Opisthorchis viverrini]KER18944.1 hypothetical protein T265_12089 [Opisthorchis viverrini]
MNFSKRTSAGFQISMDNVKILIVRPSVLIPTAEVVVKTVADISISPQPTSPNLSSACGFTRSLDWPATQAHKSRDKRRPARNLDREQSRGPPTWLTHAHRDVEWPGSKHADSPEFRRTPLPKLQVVAGCEEFTFTSLPHTTFPPVLESF